MKTYQNVQPRRRIQAKYNQNPSKLQIRAKHQHKSGLGPAKSPLAKGGGQARSPGCGYTAPSFAQPYLLLAVRSMHGEVGCMGAFLKYLTKPTSSSYKRRPPLHIHHQHTREQERRRASFLPRLQLELEQGVSELRVGGVPECRLPLLLVLGDPSTSSRRSAEVVGSLYTCTSSNQVLLGV